MKKTLVILGICLLVVSMTAATGMPIKEFGNLRTHQVPYNPTKLTNDPPDWATGNFSGVWGMNLLGIPLPPAGWVEGYYSDVLVGRLEGEFAEFNVTNATAYLKAIAFGPFLLGAVGSMETGNGTWITGLGGVNETNFYWRINLIIGPTFYMYGNYTRFEE
jgi:hypothetical protein